MIRRITAASFKLYGRVIEYPEELYRRDGKNLFRIVLRESIPVGWRIAYLVVRDRKIQRLEQHVDTFESFEPVKGRSLLYVARNKDEGAIECFRLDRPVILYKGIWHGVITLTGETDIKIAENVKVRSIYWKLKRILSGAKYR
jgi:ureidoglycolate hydrolase